MFFHLIIYPHRRSRIMKEVAIFLTLFTVGLAAAARITTSLTTALMSALRLG